MKLASFTSGAGEDLRFGMRIAERWLDVAQAGGPASFMEALVNWQSSRTVLARIENQWRERGPSPDGREFIDQRTATFLPPVGQPGKVLCVGKNYKRHLDELVNAKLIREIPEEPTGFIKLNSVLVGHDAEVARPLDIFELDYEAELAFVIGRPGYRVSRENAMSHVAGITAFNDLTSREVQRAEVKSGTRFWIAKNMPGFGPTGPYVATLDEIDDVDALWVSCIVNGEVRSRTSTAEQIYKIPAIIEHFSRYMPLSPGDMFSTGSAGGVAVAQANARDLFLKPGDIVEVTIEKVMSLRTRIV